MTTQCVHISNLQAGIAAIEISRPEALNALNSEVLTQLITSIQKLQKEDDLSVIILRTSGDKSFVAGADIKEMLNYSSQQAYEFSKQGQNVFTALSDLPQVVIAQIQGFALGGGLELALAADFMIASQKAKFGLPEVGLGLIPGFGGTQRLVQRMGYSRALEWMTSAERYSADAAFQLGLLNRVVEHDQLSSAVETVANSIAAQGPSAVRAAKKAALAALSATGQLGFEFEAQLFSQRFSGSEAREGLAAFVEKRKPEFRSVRQA
ncbi:crotonase [bacterium]|nr:crotonase [bacterium]